MPMIRDSLKWFVILLMAAVLLYFVIPKYKFMGPNDFALYRCNTITGEVMAWDIYGQKWVTPTRKMMSNYLILKKD